MQYMCGMEFIENQKNVIIGDEKINITDKLLLEKIPLEGIVRATGVSGTWLQNYANRKYSGVPRQIEITGKPKGRLTVECGELWSFALSRKNKAWVRLAADRGAGECAGCFAGARDREGAQGLWDSLPAVYRQCATAYTDFWESHNGIFPECRHRAAGKETGMTNHIERMNNAFRQRISRLARKTLSFSKKLENHIGAIWYFIHHYNAAIRQKLAA